MSSHVLAVVAVPLHELPCACRGCRAFLSMQKHGLSEPSAIIGRSLSIPSPWFAVVAVPWREPPCPFNLEDAVGFLLALEC
jgi:hypothetical protein